MKYSDIYFQECYERESEKESALNGWNRPAKDMMGFFRERGWGGGGGLCYGESV